MEFDLTLLKVAADQTGFGRDWYNFRKTVDIRTLQNLHPDDLELQTVMKNKSHIAIEDAYHEAVQALRFIPNP